MEEKRRVGVDYRSESFRKKLMLFTLIVLLILGYLNEWSMTSGNLVFSLYLLIFLSSIIGFIIKFLKPEQEYVIFVDAHDEK